MDYCATVGVLTAVLLLTRSAGWRGFVVGASSCRRFERPCSGSHSYRLVLLHPSLPEITHNYI